jgi:hypothetical protein
LTGKERTWSTNCTLSVKATDSTCPWIVAIMNNLNLLVISKSCYACQRISPVAWFGGVLRPCQRCLIYLRFQWWNQRWLVFRLFIKLLVMELSGISSSYITIKTSIVIIDVKDSWSYRLVVCVYYCDSGVVFRAICVAAIILGIFLERFTLLFLESCCQMRIKKESLFIITGWTLRSSA